MRFLDRLRNRGGSKFAGALRAYGHEKCSITDSTLLVGLPATGTLTPCISLPDDLGAVDFLAAPEQADLIRIFCTSPEAQMVQKMTIGTSHHFAEQKHPLPYDMTGAIRALSEPLLNLKHLVLGDMVQLFNGGQYYGKLGALDHIFEVCPALETLQIYGQFALKAPVSHNSLTSVETAADSIGVSGGPISQATVTHLLQSSLPKLNRLILELDEEDAEETYEIPPGFPNPDRLPGLTKIHIDPVSPETARHLLNR